MINKLKTLMAVAIVMTLGSCDNNSKETPSGLKYTVIEKGEGEVIEDGHYLIMNMLYKDDSDSIWMNTADHGMPVVVPKNDSVWSASKGSIEQIFNELKKGDSVTFTINISDFFANTVKSALPPNVNKEGLLTFEVGVKDALNQEEVMAWQQELRQKQQEEQMAKADEQLTADIAEIEAFLNEKGIEAQRTESGIFYVIHEQGQGDQAKAGDKVKVNYAGHVLNGAFFDTSYKEIAQEQGLYDERREPYGPYGFVLGQGRVIKGWDEGLTLLNKGGKATLYVPSPLAYGPNQRSEEIVANSILVFDVELVDVEKVDIVE